MDSLGKILFGIFIGFANLGNSFFEDFRIFRFGIEPISATMGF
jgi:hypothetical protein